MKIKANQTLDDKNIVEDKTTCLYYAFRNILLVSLPLVLVSAFILSLPHSIATGSGSTSSSDHVYFNLDTSCTMSSELINPHTVDINGGQYKTNVGTTKLNTYCNDGNGYSIYAIGSSNSTDGNNYLINSENNNYNISTGIYDSGTATPNTPSSWSMKLTAGTGTGNTLTPPTIVNGYDDYNIIPNTYTRVASRSSETEMNPNTDITGSYLTTTYAVYASSIQPAGSYSGNVKYVMIHPHVNNNNIGFNEAFALSGKSSVGSYYAMQDMTSDICNMVNIYDEPSQTQLVDTRDGKTYWVAKLRDEHCWMTQNLDFDIVADEQDPTKMKTITSENTDLTDYSLTGAYSQANGYSCDEDAGIISWTPATTAKTINFEGTTVTGWLDSDTVPYSASKTDNANIGHTSIGNYYNWTAAIASNSSGSYSSNTYGNISNNPKNSVCPRGWRLPIISNQSGSVIGSTNEFGRLNQLYNDGITSGVGSSTKLMESPLWFVWSGYINGATLLNHGINGSFLSSTVNNNSYIYNLYIGNDSVDPANGAYRYYYGSRRIGFSIRCLAR